MRITDFSSLLAKPGNPTKHTKYYLNGKVSLAKPVDFQNSNIKMQYFVRAVFHLIEYSSSDGGCRTALRESGRACPPSVQNTFLLPPRHPYPRGWGC